MCKKMYGVDALASYGALVPTYSSTRNSYGGTQNKMDMACSAHQMYVTWVQTLEVWT